MLISVQSYLPWEVERKKRALMDDGLMFKDICFPDGVPPDYEELKHTMKECFKKKKGRKDEGHINFHVYYYEKFLYQKLMEGRLMSR
ncbi:hypothetical protein Avbf_04879 [Armadillidium vulgare]|nr:hypothetical protein Avbf_04879 [Armadillidium vulgare]